MSSYTNYSKANTCEVEYSKDFSIRPEDIQLLQEWLKKQPHLPPISEYLLIQFYHVSGRSLQHAKKLIEVHYDFRNVAGEFFPGQTHDIFFELCYSFSMPCRTPEGHSIHYLGLRNTDSSIFNFNDLLVTQMRIIHADVLSEGIGTGAILIWDTAGFTLSHLTRMPLSALRKGMYYNEYAIPTKVQRLYFIGMNTIANKLCSVLRQFMHDFSKRMHVISDLNSLHEFVPKNYLPAELGGTLPLSKDNLQEMTKCRVRAVAKNIDEEFGSKPDESKRIGPKLGRDSAVSDSFKKIEID